jgi:hypothetical protein
MHANARIEKQNSIHHYLFFHGAFEKKQNKKRIY